ncbi:hypothetical protein KBTX_04198 [wastewater metagenome]|uniref:Uncharacterized protein n=2 Tax=unclassified sequences TaxID=12908 RepID=A0A5B8RIG4_9ZZZZ|nr:hypothetical protein KBTEX_04198 [uncultured organism]
MKSSEEIADELIEQYALDGDYTVLCDYKYLFEKSMKAHTTATLDRLKERVEGLKFDEDYKGMEGSYIAGNNEALDEVIAVIDEVRND